MLAGNLVVVEIHVRIEILPIEVLMRAAAKIMGIMMQVLYASDLCDE